MFSGERRLPCRLWGHDHGDVWSYAGLDYQCRRCGRVLGGDPATRYSGYLGPMLIALLFWAVVITYVVTAAL